RPFGMTIQDALSAHEKSGPLYTRVGPLPSPSNSYLLLLAYVLRMKRESHVPLAIETDSLLEIQHGERNHFVASFLCYTVKLVGIKPIVLSQIGTAVLQDKNGGSLLAWRIDWLLGQLQCPALLQRYGLSNIGRTI